MKKQSRYKTLRPFNLDSFVKGCPAEDENGEVYIFQSIDPGDYEFNQIRVKSKNKNSGGMTVSLKGMHCGAKDCEFNLRMSPREGSLPTPAKKIKKNPYAHLETARKQGKTIQYSNLDGTWRDRTGSGDYPAPPERYRVKPDPVPLEASDVVPGQLFRRTGTKEWWEISGMDAADNVYFVRDAGGYTLKDLMLYWEYSPDRGLTWKPCSKQPK